MASFDEKLVESFGNIETGFDVLIDEYREFQKKLNTCITEQLNKDNDSDLDELIELRKQSKNYIEHIIGFRNGWNDTLKSHKCFSNDIIQDISDDDEDDDTSSTIDRTSWRIINSTVKIETIRPNNRTPYTNNIPVQLFKESALTIVEQFERYKKDTIKTSSIEVLMRDKIITESSYKKATKSFIYSIFKVLQKEDMIKPFENTKRIYALSRDIGEIKAWIEKNFE